MRRRRGCSRPAAAAAAGNMDEGCGGRARARKPAAAPGSRVCCRAAAHCCWTKPAAQQAAPSVCGRARWLDMRTPGPPGGSRARQPASFWRALFQDCAPLPFCVSPTRPKTNPLRPPAVFTLQAGRLLPLLQPPACLYHHVCRSQLLCPAPPASLLRSLPCSPFPYPCSALRRLPNLIV